MMKEQIVKAVLEMSHEEKLELFDRLGVQIICKPPQVWDDTLRRCVDDIGPN